MTGPVKRSVTLAGHRTSVSLEPEFWNALREIAAGEGRSLQALIEQIDRARGEEGLSTALRLHALAWFRDAAGRARH